MKLNQFFKVFFSFFTAAVFVAGITGFSFAQDGSTTIDRLKETISEQQRQEAVEKKAEELKEEKQKEEEAKKKDAETIGLEKAEEVEDENDKKVVFLKKIEFSESDIFPESFFAAIREKYENKDVSINDIYTILNTINNEYLISGYIASKAFLPEQDITEGSLYISLVEGFVDKVNIVGNKWTSEKYIKRYINFDKVENLNANDANQQVMNFNAANDARARISLSPGEVFGTSDVDIVIEEPKWYSLNVFVDNSGQDETGLIRYGGYATVRSLTKFRDIFNIGGVFSEGSNAVYASYEIPEPFLKTRVGIGADYSDTEIVNGGLKTLDVTGNYYNVYLYLKKPFFIKETTVTNATFNVTTKNGASYISGYKTQDTKTDTLSLSGDNTWMTSFGYIFNMLSYTQGLKLIEGEMNFEKVSYYGEGYTRLPLNFGFNLKLKAQCAFDKVPSAEQISIGGMNSVRGYVEGMLMAKDGITANAELIYNVNFIKTKYVDYTRVFGFFDYGVVFPEEDVKLYDDYDYTIFSTGFGLKFGIFKYLESNLVCAFPLRDHKYYDVPETKFLFMVQGRI